MDRNVRVGSSPILSTIRAHPFARERPEAPESTFSQVLFLWITALWDNGYPGEALDFNSRTAGDGPADCFYSPGIWLILQRETKEIFFT